VDHKLVSEARPLKTTRELKRLEEATKVEKLQIPDDRDATEPRRSKRIRNQKK
jgi:hypothetical protein